MQKEIWLLLDSSQFGGIESHVLELASALKQYTAVRVVFLSEQLDHPLLPKLTQREISFDFCRHGMASLIHLVRDNRPVIIHTHGYKAGVVARFLSIFSDFKCISTFHAGEKLSGKLKIYDWLDRHSAFMCQHIFTVSHIIADRIPLPTELAKNFVDTERCQGSSGSQIAFVGRVSIEKGPDLFSDLAKSCRLLSFHLYGDGPMYRELELGCPKNMCMHGRQDRMEAVWSKVGLLIVSSRQEGMPMAIIEAMSRGIPVIAFNVGSIARLIDHGKNGWLVEPGKINVMRECLYDWLEMSRPQQLAICDMAKGKVERHFSARAVIPRYLRVYRQVSPRLSVQIPA